MSPGVPSASLPEPPRGRWIDVDAEARAIVTLNAPLAPVWAALPEDADDVVALERAADSALVGWGEAWQARAAGPERLRALDAARAELFDVFDDLGPPEHPAPCLVLGFAFEAEVDEAWSGFGAARLRLPRITYRRDGDRAWLQVAVEPGGDRARLERQIDEAMARLRAAAPSVAVRAHAIEAPQGRGAWRAAMGLVQGVLTSGRADKVVLSRRIELVAEPAPSLRDLVAALWTGPGRGHRFLFAAGRDAFFGVTPERLVRAEGGVVESAALAGSRPRDVPADGLLEDPKERAEHDYVAAHVRAVLASFCGDVQAPDTPALMRLGYVTHLHTPMQGRLRAPTSVLALAQALHPTPAVGGVPLDVARAAIAEAEGRARGWYTGGIGWVSAAGEGEVWVALRSGRLAAGRGHAFVGAGIVRGSDAEREWDETEAKAQGILRALGATEA